jgi:ABC-type polysaccharide/polyol phosphate transport system ATPase subunit
MSDSDVVLRTRGLRKEFVAGGQRPTVFALLRRLVVPGGSGIARFRSLDGIDVEVRRGEIVGLIGENGAGKSTLLKTVAGVYRPDGGSVEVRGSVTLLGGLGVGMVDELSVLHNVHLYGAICRIPRETLRERLDEILEWSELEAFRDAELRTLSTGMRTRLAFAISMHIDSQLLLMDEAFSAGDSRFRDRCDAFFGRPDRGPATLVATHSLDFVERFCARTVWIRRGRQVDFGPTVSVLKQYRERAAG